MNKVLEYIIGAKDATGSAISSALNRIKSFSKSVFSNLVNIQAGFGMLGNAANKAMAFMRKAFAYETMAVQFKTLIGKMDEAREHMAMLQKLGETPPFSLEQFAAASRALMVMTDGVLGYKQSLELVGDAAAATGQPVEALAHEVGRAYAIIRDGQPLTRATMALRNMGVLTPEVAQKLQDLQDAGKSNVEIWDELQKAIGRYKGAMAETEQTGEGLIGAIQAQWDNTLREFGAACLETAKDGLGAILQMMKDLSSDGSIDVWADKTARAVKSVTESLKACAPVVSWLWNALTGTFDAIGSELGRFAGAISMGNIGDAFGGIGTETARAYTKAFDLDGEQAKRAEEIRYEARKRYAEKAAREELSTAKKNIEEQYKLKKSLEDAQKKKDEKEKAEKEKAEKEKAEKEVEKQVQRQISINLNAAKANYSTANSNQNEAQARLSAAKDRVEQLWQYYEDPNGWQRYQNEVVEAQRRRQNAIARFNSDYYDMQHGKQRTTDALTQAMANALKERDDAEQYAKETAEAAKKAAENLERLNQHFEEGKAE